CPGLLASAWPIYSEMRARRDVGLHAGWKSNRIYLSKAGANAASEETKWLYPDEQYFESSCEAALSLIETMSCHCNNKFARCSPQDAFKEMWEQSPLAKIMDFDKAWDDGSIPRPRDEAKNWHWSRSEKLYFDFFLHIFSWRTNS